MSALVEVGLLADDGLLDEGGVERAGRAREQVGDHLAGHLGHRARPAARVTRTTGASNGVGRARHRAGFGPRPRSLPRTAAIRARLPAQVDEFVACLDEEWRRRLLDGES